MENEILQNGGHILKRRGMPRVFAGVHLIILIELLDLMQNIFKNSRNRAPCANT